MPLVNVSLNIVSGVSFPCFFLSMDDACLTSCVPTMVGGADVIEAIEAKRSGILKAMDEETLKTPIP